MPDVGILPDYGFSVRDAVARWTHGPDWRTWVAHTVLGLVIALVFGLVGWLGWQVAIGYYLIRELEQILYAVVARKPIDWLDAFMDVAVPSAVVLVAAAVVLSIF
jgi:hypothetical protein